MQKNIEMKYNRRIFPIYKGLAWDPLFYGAIIILFLTEVKGIEISKIMYAESLYAFFLLIFQLPASIIIERIGSRKSLILGCTLVTIQIAMMMIAKNFTFLVLAYSFSAFGTAIKETAQYTLLYDSTNLCKGKNSFENVDAKGSSVSYIFNATSSVMAGYLYIVNPYLPITLSSIVSLITVVISFRFEELHEKNQKRITMAESLKELNQGLRFIAQSKRLRALLLFIAFFSGILIMVCTYEKSLLQDLNVGSQYFGIIFAILTLLQCFSVQYQDKIHNKFKNKTLAFLAIPIFTSFIFIGLINFAGSNKFIIISIIIIAFFVQHFLRAPYWVLQNKYVTNFTNSDIRTKILSATEIIEGIGRIIFSFLGGLLLEYYNTSQSYAIMGIAGMIILFFILKYMKKRVGLSPEEYNKKDIEYIN